MTSHLACTIFFRIWKFWIDWFSKQLSNWNLHCTLYVIFQLSLLQRVYIFHVEVPNGAILFNFDTPHMESVKILHRRCTMDFNWSSLIHLNGSLLKTIPLRCKLSCEAWNFWGYTFWHSENVTFRTLKFHDFSNYLSHCKMYLMFAWKFRKCLLLLMKINLRTLKYCLSHHRQSQSKLTHSQKYTPSKRVWTNHTAVCRVDMYCSQGHEFALDAE